MRYTDLLGTEGPADPHLSQRLMRSRLLPRIYEGLWRPLGARVLLGAIGPGTAEEHRIALEMLEIAPGDRVLDIGCGPGNFTRDFAGAAGDGSVVGLDSSATMLARAVQEGGPGNLAYVRADACALPFPAESFDGVCCFAALYLIDEPMAALEEMVRVLAPGGRLALLASCRRGPLSNRLAGPAVHALSGVRLFGRDELTGALSAQGLIGVEQRLAGFGQFVSARKPPS